MIFALAMLCGLPLAIVIDRRAKGTLLAGEALLFGIALCALVLLVVPWSRVAFLLAVLVLSGAPALLPARRTPDETPIERNPIAWIFHALTLTALTGYTLLATSAPPPEFDYLSDWGLKARQFFFARGIDWAFLQTASDRLTHPDYPPLVPLAYDSAAVLRGSWDDRYLGLFNVAFAVGLLLVVYRIAVEELRAEIPAAFVTFAMMPLAASPWMGIADGAFVAYATSALLLIRRGSVEAGTVMLALAALTKNEGVTLIVAVVIAGAPIKRLWPVLIALPWFIARSMHHLQTDIARGDVSARILQRVSHGGDLLLSLARHMPAKPLLWIGLAVGLLLMPWRRERFVLVAIGVQLAFYMVAYLATPHDMSWHVSSSWERLVIHLATPLTAVMLLQLLRHLAKSRVLY